MKPTDSNPTILEKIVSKRRESFPLRFSKDRLAEFKKSVGSMEKPRPFFEALSASDEWTLIAEIKAKSPSKGKLMAEPDPDLWAKRYERCGAHAISIVTEENFFRGNPDWIRQVKKVSKLPVLRKDFLTTSEEILESRAVGSDAVLLIAAILDLHLLKSLVSEVIRYGMEPLVEIHNRSEAETALATQARMIGINNRNLHDFSIDIETTKKLIPLLKDRHVVSESGIFSSKEVKELYPCGVKTFLVGEAILTSKNPEQKIAELLGRVCLSDNYSDPLSS